MKLLRKIANSNNKNNKTRSILVIISIALTTILLTSIGTFIYGSLEHNIKYADEMYGSYYGTFVNVTENQVKDMKLHNFYTDIGKSAFAGIVDNEKNIGLVWIDGATSKLTNTDDKLIKGTFPIKENEIAGSKELFKTLGYDNVNIGDNVKITSRFDNSSKYEEHEFIISGILSNENNKTDNAKYVSYISKGFYEKQSRGNNIYSVYFRLNENIDITGDNQEEVIKDLGKDLGLQENQINVNNYYLLFELKPATELIVGGIIVALLVIVFSIIVIYNIFQIGILQKIQEYGKIKALGATKKQIKKIVIYEGMSLGLIGIPIGLILGVLVGGQLFYLMQNMSYEVFEIIKISRISLISIPLLAFVTVLSFIIIRLALIKPVKIVSKISPIEAIRYQGMSKVTKLKRKGKKTVKIKDIIYSNFSINKSRTIKTILTMGLSCVLFVIIANIAGNFDVEYEARKNMEQGHFNISLSYSFFDEAYPENNLDNILKSNPLDENLIEDIKNISGVKNVDSRSIMIAENPDTNSDIYSMSVITKEDFERIKKYSGEYYIGNKNYEDIVANNGILYGYSPFFKEEGYRLNEIIDFKINNGFSKENIDANVQGTFASFRAPWAIPEEVYNKLGLENSIGDIWIDCEKKDEKKIEEELEKLISNKEHLETTTYTELIKQTESHVYLTKGLSYTFLIILGLIGFMNMANTIIISIITRKQEFGVLQAVGMTNRQLNRMLQSEGLIFTIGTIVVSLLIGIPLGYLAFDYAKNVIHMFGLNVYNIPYVEIIAMILVIALLQGILSFVLSRNVKKESLIDRIRFYE